MKSSILKVILALIFCSDVSGMEFNIFSYAPIPEQPRVFDRLVTFSDLDSAFWSGNYKQVNKYIPYFFDDEMEPRKNFKEKYINEKINILHLFLSVRFKLNYSLSDFVGDKLSDMLAYELYNLILDLGQKGHNNKKILFYFHEYITDPDVGEFIINQMPVASQLSMLAYVVTALNNLIQRAPFDYLLEKYQGRSKRIKHWYIKHFKPQLDRYKKKLCMRKDIYDIHYNLMEFINQDIEYCRELGADMSNYDGGPIFVYRPNSITVIRRLGKNESEDSDGFSYASAGLQRKENNEHTLRRINSFGSLEEEMPSSPKKNAILKRRKSF